VPWLPGKLFSSTATLHSAYPPSQVTRGMEGTVDPRELISCIVAGAFVSGCSSSYMPRPGPRVAMIQQSGTPAYVRDGKVYEGGIFGGDIVEAVRGNPEAESHARAYKNQTIGGFLATLAGGISMISGALLLSSGSRTDNGGSNNTETTAGGLLLAGGLGAYITGFVLILTAQPHMWDAINVYNDGVPMMPYAYPPPPPGYYYPPAPPRSLPPSSPGAPIAPASTAPAPAR
jgi:hypothetical protein